MPPAVVRQNNKPVVKAKKTGSIRDRIGALEDLPETGIKLLIYGRSKTGKTTLAASAPTKMLWVSSETGEVGGIKSLGKMKGIDFIQLQNPEEMKDIIALAMEYKTVVVDTVTQLESMILASILGIEKLPEQKSWGMAQREHYGQCGLQTKTYLRSLLDLPNNTILLGQERQSDPREDSELITPTVGVALQPATAGWLNAAMDYIGSTFIRKEMKQVKRTVGKNEIISQEATGRMEYCLRVGPDPVYVTGFRKPKSVVLPDVLVDPTYADLRKLITG